MGMRVSALVPSDTKSVGERIALCHQHFATKHVPVREGLRTGSVLWNAAPNPVIPLHPLHVRRVVSLRAERRGGPYLGWAMDWGLHRYEQWPRCRGCRRRWIALRSGH